MGTLKAVIGSSTLINMFEILLLAQVTTSNYVCWMDMGSGIVDLTYMCADGSEGEAASFVVSDYSRFLENYSVIGAPEFYTDEEIIADGLLYCQQSETLSADELVRWRIEQRESASTAQEANRIGNHWSSIAVYAPRDICP